MIESIMYMQNISKTIDFTYLVWYNVYIPNISKYKKGREEAWKIIFINDKRYIAVYEKFSSMR